MDWNNNETKQQNSENQIKVLPALTITDRSKANQTIAIGWFIHTLRSGWLVLSCTEPKLFIRIIYVWQSVFFFYDGCCCRYRKLCFELRGIAHRSHWNARTDDSYTHCVSVCASRKVIAVDSILPHPFHRLLLLLLSNSPTFLSPFSRVSLSIPLYCKVVFPCVTFSQLLMNHPIIGAKYVSRKLFARHAVSPQNANCARYSEKHFINSS